MSKKLFKGSHPPLFVFMKAIEKEARNRVQKLEDTTYGKVANPFTRYASVNEILD